MPQDTSDLSQSLGLIRGETLSRGVLATVVAFSPDDLNELRIVLECRDAHDAEEKIELLTYIADNLRKLMKGQAAESPLLTAIKLSNVEAMFLFEKWFDSLNLARRGDTVTITSHVPRTLLTHLLANAESQAVETLRKQEQIAKENAEYDKLIESGKNLLAQDKHEEAMRAFERAKELKRGSNEPANLISEAEFQRLIHDGQEAISDGDFDRASDCFERARRLRAGSEQVRQGLKEIQDRRFEALLSGAKRFLAAGDLDQAEGAVREALVLRPDHLEAKPLLTDILNKQAKDGDAGLKLAERVQELNAAVPDVQVVNRRLFLERGGLVKVEISLRNVSKRPLNDLNALVEFADPVGRVQRLNGVADRQWVGPLQTATITIQMPKSFDRYRVLLIRSGATPLPFRSIPDRFRQGNGLPP